MHHCAKALLPLPEALAAKERKRGFTIICLGCKRMVVVFNANK
jgi:hypothetical protein